jgi:polar amino acid transport system substrate-binding protein/glutamate/aspartate transport system substrate-binding protein
MTRLLLLAALTVLAASPATGQDLQGTLKKISDTKTINIGYRETAVPFSFVGADKQPAGYTVDLCRRVAGGIQQQLKLADLKINWVMVTSENRIQMVANGTVDIECGTTTHTLSRSEQVDFSLMTFVDGGTFLVRTEGKIASISDLSGKKVGVIPSTTTATALNDALQRSFTTVQIVPVKDHADGLAALERGAVDAYASDRTILIGLAVTSKDHSKLMLSDQGFSYEPYGLVVRRNDSAFRLAVNRVLANIYRGAQIVEIYNRWFGAFGRPSTLLQIMYLLNAIPE